MSYEEGPWNYAIYQEESIAALMALRDDRNHVHVVSLPTGSGKTVVLSVFLGRLLSKNPKSRVLIVAPNWQILGQIHDNIVNGQPEFKQAIGRIGGNGRRLRWVPDAAERGIYLTTLKTWSNRSAANTLPAVLNDGELVVVIDESHWAMNAQLGKSLRSAYLGKAFMIGLSATPNLHAGGDYRVAYHKNYGALCPEFLARPKVYTVPTGEVWNPCLRNVAITRRSFRRLGCRAMRNDLIARECDSGLRAGLYKRVIIFACDIAHAKRLHGMLVNWKIAAVTYHPKQQKATQEKSLQEFRDGTKTVLVTVQMATTGLDIPEIDAVFLARPSESLILLAQMIGRGSRKLPHKDSFWIVEFTDVVRRHEDKIFHARDYVGDAGVMPVGTGTYRPITRHREPQAPVQFQRLQLPGLDGLTFAPGQTFGVEIELACPPIVLEDDLAPWSWLIDSVIDSVKSAAAAPVEPRFLEYHEADDFTKWRVTMDGSTGFEVISPILTDSQGFEEVMRVSEALRRLLQEHSEVYIDHTAGLHVTLATQLDTPGRQQRLASLITRLEPGLFPLVSPSRPFCSTALVTTDVEITSTASHFVRPYVIAHRPS